MKNIIVATFNIKNKYNDKEDIYRARELLRLINENNIDILGVQEVSNSLLKEIKNIFKGYYVVESFRIKDINNRFNESNTIISRYPIISNKNLWLSNTPNEFSSHAYFSLYPRNVNIAKIKIDCIIINFLTTHLDIFKYTRIRQLKSLYSIVEKEINGIPTFVVGDFNTPSKRKYFKDFYKKMKTLGLQFITNEEPTFKIPFISYFRQTLDHIFIPSNYKMNSIRVIDTNISDHKMVVLDVNIKN